MEFKKYQTARDGNPVGDPFDGHSTMLALQGVLGKKFEPSAPMTRLLVRWGEELLEKVASTNRSNKVGILGAWPVASAI